MPRELEPSAARTETGGAERSGRRYEYGTLTEDFLKALPKKPMSLGESLCGDSKAAQRIRQLGAAYGPVANGALREAMRIKYLEGAEQGGKAGESKDGTQGHIDVLTQPCKVSQSKT